MKFRLPLLVALPRGDCGTQTLHAMQLKLQKKKCDIEEYGEMSIIHPCLLKKKSRLRMEEF